MIHSPALHVGFRKVSCYIHMGVSKNKGGPPKWMVKIMENPMNKWMIWGYHYFWKHPYPKSSLLCSVIFVPSEEVYQGDLVIFRSGLYHGLEQLSQGTRFAILGFGKYRWELLGMQRNAWFLHQLFSHVYGCISSTGTSPADTVTTGAGGTRGREGAIYHIESPKRIDRLMIFGRFRLSTKDRISQC